ncbi:MAG: peptidase C1 [Methylococcaceae bacterium]|nr:peptidase C1 [Methylococcaceae bacterium]
MANTSSLSYAVDRITGSWRALSGCQLTEATDAQSYSAERFAEDELPQQVDLREFMTGVENQAGANSCTANAVVGGYEYFMNRLGYEVDFSRLFLYYNARALAAELEGEEEILDQGSSISQALEMLMDQGLCHEDTWPYEVKDDGKVVNVNEPPAADAYDEAEELKDVPEFQWEQPEKIPLDLHTMKHCLAEGYPFVFGLTLFKSFDQVNSHGRVPMPDFDSEEGRESHGNHAMLCVGYKDSIESFIVRNSWGEEWGEDGYCYIPYQYFTDEELCFECWKIKGQTDVDLSEEVWFEDEEVDEEFYEEAEEGDTCYLTQVEAIAVICLLGCEVDGLASEEADLLDALYEEYEINTDALQEKIDALIEAGGLDMLYNASIQVILAEDLSLATFQISAEFAIADEELTEEEMDYWGQLAKDLEIAGETATALFNETLEKYDLVTFETLF